MNRIVEAVARELCVLDGHFPDRIFSASGKAGKHKILNWQSYSDSAKRVIDETLRQIRMPRELVIEAMGDASSPGVDWPDSYSDDDLKVIRSGLSVIWQAGIDAILKEMGDDD